MDDKTKIVKLNLEKKCDLTKYGTFLIYGESPSYEGNYEPLLGAVEGIYDHALHYALSLDKFITLGNGGRIELIDVKLLNADIVSKRIFLREERDKLKNRLNTIEELLQ